MNEVGLNATGWIFMLFAWGVIFTLVGFCFKKIFSTPDTDFEHPEHMQEPGGTPGT